MAHEDVDARTIQTFIKDVTRKELEEMIQSLEDGTMLMIIFAREGDRDE